MYIIMDFVSYLCEKGKKDRYTLLSETILEILREYWKKFKPQKWLFEGASEGKGLSARTADKILRRRN